ncbi:MAG: MATE family efflux transporter [Eubacteriales bacterium]
MKKTDVSITEGSLYKNIIIFSIPLIFSNVLQVLFNMSDIAVVGQFAGSKALGAVGSCAILVTLFTGLLIGMGGGINAVAARHMGAENKDKVVKTVHTSFLISIIYGLIIMVIGLLIVRDILLLMKTKDELLDEAVLYMRVYLLGTPAMALYNYGNGILSASGDSKRSLYYLLSAGILNISLNLFFVIVCRMSVLGVALASAISQYLSAALILIHLFRCGEVYSLSLSAMKINVSVAKNILLLGISAGFQNAIFAIANLFIQSAVNSFDTVMVEGNSAAANADSLIYDMMAAVYVACTTFMAQNYGAGNKDRIIKSYKICLIYSFSIAAAAGILLVLFGRQFLSLFTPDTEVIEAGLKRLNIMAFSYAFSAFMDCTIAASRGLGKTILPTVIVILGSCVFRIIWIYTVFAHFHTIPSLYLLYIFSWSITAVMEVICFMHYFKKQTKSLAPIPSH